MASGTSREDCTVYVISADEVGTEIRSSVASWTAAGVVDGSLWVTPDSFQSDGAGPPRITATELVGDRQETVDLFTAIGTRSLRNVRVVVAHPITSESAGDAAVVQASRALVRAIDDALPRRTRDEQDPRGTRLRKVNAIIPVSGVTGASDQLLQPGWDANVVVSPEDRPDLDRATVYVRHPGNFVGHASAALCAIGGLLTGMDEGALDHLELDSTTHDDELLVARVTVRSVVGEDIVEDLARDTFDLDSFGPEGPASVTPGFRVASDPDRLAHQASEHVLASGPWQRSEEPPTSIRTPSTQSLGAALRHAIGFNLRMFGVMMRWLLSLLRISVEQRATRLIVGQHGGVDVRIGAAPADDIADAAERYLGDIEAERRRVESGGATDLVHLSPAAWTLVREMATALVDGSSLPAGFPEPRVAGKRELLPPSAIAPLIDEAWDGMGDRRISAVDIRGARDYAAWLDQRHDEDTAKRESLVVKQESLEEELDAKRAELEVLENKAEDDEDDDGKSEAAVRRARKAIERIEKRVTDVESKISDLDASLEALEREKSGFETWNAGNSTYLTALLEEIVDRRDSLEAEQTAEETPPSAPPRERLVKRQRLARILWSVTLIVFAITLGLIVWTGVSDGGSVVDMAVPGAIALGVALLVLAVANHGFFKAVRRYEWEMSQLVSLQRSRVEQAAWRVTELRRLQFQETAMGDWARILSLMIRSPWHQEPPHVFEMSDEVVDALPASMGVAGVERAESLPYQSVAAAARTVYRQGWLGNVFDTVAQAFDDVEIDGDTGFTAVDSDTTLRPSGPRRRFLEYVEDPSSRAVATQHARARFAAAVDSQEIPIPTRHVARRGPYSRQLRVVEPDYFAAVADDATAFANDVFTPTGRQRLAHHVSRSAAWLPGSVEAPALETGLHVTRAHGANAVRMDLSRRVELRDLAIFASAMPRGEKEPEREPEQQAPEPNAGGGIVWS